MSTLESENWAFSDPQIVLEGPMENTLEVRARLGKSAQLLVALLGLSTVILGCGIKSPSSSASAAKAPPSDLGATSKRDRTPLGKTTLQMTYELIFADSTGVMDIWIDGDFLRIEETWKRSEATPSLRWGTTRVGCSSTARPACF
jgi:hypothetical protein